MRGVLAKPFDEELLLGVEDRIVNSGATQVNSGDYFHNSFSILYEMPGMQAHGRRRFRARTRGAKVLAGTACRFATDVILTHPGPKHQTRAVPRPAAGWL